MSTLKMHYLNLWDLNKCFENSQKSQGKNVLVSQTINNTNQGIPGIYVWKMTCTNNIENSNFGITDHFLWTLIFTKYLELRKLQTQNLLLSRQNFGNPKLPQAVNKSASSQKTKKALLYSQHSLCHELGETNGGEG